jgi:hypothetical protein
MATRRPEFVTPEGVLCGWIALNEPDRNRDDNKDDDFGEYKCALRVPDDDCLTFKGQLEAEWAEHLDRLRSGKRKPKIHQTGGLPWEAEEDDDGEPTGHTVFKFKLKARAGLRSGNAFDMRPHIIELADDGKGERLYIPPAPRCMAYPLPKFDPAEEEVVAKRLRPCPQIGAGTRAKIHGRIHTWDYQGAGMTLWCEDVLIIELVEGQARSSEGYQFADVTEMVTAGDADISAFQGDGNF